MPIQTTPTSGQAIDYLTTTALMTTRDMSKAMYKLLNSCARVVHRTYPNMAGYYDPEYVGMRIEPEKHLHWAARHAETIPQSARLLDLTAPKISNPFANLVALLGL